MRMPALAWTAPTAAAVARRRLSDASGNSASASFVAHVTLVQTPPPSVPKARWDDPVGASAGIVVNGSRSIPVKVWLTLDGNAVRSGPALLSVAPCDGGGAVQTAPLDVQSNGRWTGHLDTSGLTPGCYQVVASVDGQAFGSFRMDVRGGSVPTAKPVKTHEQAHDTSHDKKSHLKAPAPHHKTPVAKHSKCRGKP